MSDISVNKIHYPVTTLGWGRRVGIWFQGCSIRCAGCLSKDTWKDAPEYMTTLASLLDGIRKWLKDADGVTISGGEPFDQPEALHELVASARMENGGDILVYSGYEYEVLMEQHRSILETIDVLVSGPYVEEAGDTLILRGSDNQRIHLLTQLAKSRYPSDIDRMPWGATRQIDVVVNDDEIWFAGIPRAGELQTLRNVLEKKGITCSTSDQSEG
jgi:anaerobic ribonucleoside-triphosphate reductase activating protein